MRFCRTFHALFFAASLVEAIPSTPKNGLSCGAVPGKCANTTAAQGPIKVKQGEYVTNVYQWQNWPTVLSWDQCQKQCQATKGCESFNYQFQFDNPFVPSLWECNLFFHPVSNYTIACNSGDPTLATYWDKDCPKLTPTTAGTVPSHPSSDGVNGTCDSVRPPRDVVQLFQDQIGTGFHINQTECANYCRRTKDCKSYWWQSDPTAQFNRPYTVHEQYYPWNSTSTDSQCSLSPPQCILFSQPVASYVKDGTGAFASTALYDVNCPTGSNSTASPSYVPFKHGPEPDSCKTGP